MPYTTRRLGDGLDLTPPSIATSGGSDPFDIFRTNVDTGGAFDLTPPPSVYSFDSSSSNDNTWSPDNVLKYLQAGLITYADFQRIQRGDTYPGGQPAPYGGGPAAPPGGAVAPPAAGFDWNALTDFSTPWPYVIGLVVIGGGWFLYSSTKKRRR